MTDSSYLGASNLSFKPRSVLKSGMPDRDSTIRIEDQKYGATLRSTRNDDWGSTRPATMNTTQQDANNQRSRVKVWTQTPIEVPGDQRVTKSESHYKVPDKILGSKPTIRPDNRESEEPLYIREARKYHPNLLVEASMPHLVESEDRRANFIDYRHFDSFEFEPGPYGVTSEYLSKKLMDRNYPPHHDSQYLGRSSNGFHSKGILREDAKDHHLYPRGKHSAAGEYKDDPLFGSTYDKFIALEDHLNHRREIPDIQSEHAYYGPSYINYKHALARHPTMIEDVDFKTCYHKLYEDSGNDV